MTNIGRNIKQIRSKNNMTQEELAEALFVTRQTISNYETGKSKPDIDTIIKIAKLFKIDANTVIYGLPLEEKQKRARNWAIGTGIFLAILLILNVAINTFFNQYTLFFAQPQRILKFSLFPFTLFVCGFYAMHLISLFSPLKPFNNKASKIIKIFLLIIIFVLTAAMLYFTAFSTVSFIKELQLENYSMSWPGFFGNRLILNITLEYPFSFSILGALSWLFELIYKEK